MPSIVFGWSAGLLACAVTVACEDRIWRLTRRSRGWLGTQDAQILVYVLTFFLLFFAHIAWLGSSRLWELALARRPNVDAFELLFGVGIAITIIGGAVITCFRWSWGKRSIAHYVVLGSRDDLPVLSWSQDVGRSETVGYRKARFALWFYIGFITLCTVIGYFAGKPAIASCSSWARSLVKAASSGSSSRNDSDGTSKALSNGSVCHSRVDSWERQTFVTIRASQV